MSSPTKTRKSNTAGCIASAAFCTPNIVPACADRTPSIACRTSKSSVGHGSFPRPLSTCHCLSEDNVPSMVPVANRNAAAATNPMTNVLGTPCPGAAGKMCASVMITLLSRPMAWTTPMNRLLLEAYVASVPAACACAMYAVARSRCKRKMLFQSGPSPVPVAIVAGAPGGLASLGAAATHRPHSHSRRPVTCTFRHDACAALPHSRHSSCSGVPCACPRWQIQQWACVHPRPPSVAPPAARAGAGPGCLWTRMPSSVWICSLRRCDNSTVGLTGARKPSPLKDAVTAAPTLASTSKMPFDPVGPGRVVAPASLARLTPSVPIVLMCSPDRCTARKSML
mmetsp:Transcript_35585/g.88937  ORF Transcript_35585/g.88937 Transcript_35585/m.88937 type:complete len:339 (-) Transcript_35585:2020-3036(-)